MPSLSWSTRAPGSPKEPNRVASQVRIDGVSARPIVIRTHPKPMAAGRDSVWHCSMLAVLARSRSWVCAMTRAMCSRPRDGQSGTVCRPEPPRIADAETWHAEVCQTHNEAVQTVDWVPSVPCCREKRSHRRHRRGDASVEHGPLQSRSPEVAIRGSGRDADHEK